MGVGYKPDRPIRVSLKSKQNKVSIKYITAEEVDESGDEKIALPRTSVFDRIQTSTTTSLKQSKTSSSEQSSRTSAFKRLEVTPLNKSKRDSKRVPRASAFSRLGVPASKIDDNDFGATTEMEARPKEDRETRSLVLSRMKQKTKIDVNNDGILKVKRRTIVITGQGKHQVEKKSVNDEKVVEAVYHITVEEDATLDTPWMMFFDGAAQSDGAGAGVVFISPQRLPEDIRHKTKIRRRAPRFIYYKDTLFRRFNEGLFLRCLEEDEVVQAMDEAHSGVCGAHQSGPKLHFRIKMMGYYWPTMVKDCLDYAKRCQACQFHANFIHQPLEPLHPTVASWPFDPWRLDGVGPLPKSSGGHLYILVATDYFSKWA
ncbi:hypothetical protein RJ640_027004 [Escallonia rubra]|uniref:Integrase catalytic domain-containing protein n=1 Tax=Escallonia rubra TaxID=112253 RepID=A0AA88QUB8_9ASTE|nr:hypothetical protein RJ640_027004 [Escallonia rubra]